MPFPAQAYNIMIASPSDVRDERQIIRELIREASERRGESESVVFLPLMWEIDAVPRMGRPAQSILNEQLLTRADILLAIFWSRLGTPTDEYLSGTVEEISRQIEAGKPTMIYFCDRAFPNDIDVAQVELVRKFRAWCQHNGLVSSFISPENLKEVVARHLESLQREISCQVKAQGIAGRIFESATPEENRFRLTEDAQKLLRMAARNKSGMVVKARTFGGLTIRPTDQPNLVTEGDARSEARWTAALEELERLDLLRIERHGTTAKIYRVTQRGYQLNEKMR